MNNYKIGELQVFICPHTKMEVVMAYLPGDTDGKPDWLCLHSDNDAEDVAKFREDQKIKK